MPYFRSKGTYGLGIVDGIGSSRKLTDCVQKTVKSACSYRNGNLIEIISIFKVIYQAVETGGRQLGFLN